MLQQTDSVVEGSYFQDLMEQPAALQTTLAWLKAPGRWDGVLKFFSSRRWKRVVLTGMGSSFYAFQPLALRLYDHGATPVLMETAELIHYGRALLDEQTLLIAASQSGRSAEIVRLLDVNQRSPLLGITNTADSPLAQASDHLLLTHAGFETSVSCKTYVAMILLLQWLSAAIENWSESDCVRLLEPSAALAEKYLGSWRQHTEELAARLRDTRHLFLTGRGGSLAAACTGALILKESTRVHAEGMSSAAFRHGPMEMLQNGMFTAVFAGDARTVDLNRQLIRDLMGKGGQSAEIGVEASTASLRLPESAQALWPILEILPIQMMSLAIAAVNGREAGIFRNATKVTAVE